MMICHATAIENVRNYFISPHRMNVFLNIPGRDNFLPPPGEGKLEDDNCVSRPHHHSFPPSIDDSGGKRLIFQFQNINRNDLSHTSIRYYIPCKLVIINWQSAKIIPGILKKR